ncbi:gas vesicle protein [Candidatus Bathyarchaeota archaeon]|nr:gas vesicle protein [Candidatus Bathyarchaeota archaeon]
MEPIRDARITLVDLLDRILDKGLLINADLIISVAGVPLIGVKLNAAIASVETMLKYGIMADLCGLRKSMNVRDEKKMLKLLEQEKVINKFYGSIYFSEGLYPTWRYGYFYVTDRRIILVRKEPFEVLTEIHYREIERVSPQSDFKADNEINHLILHLKTGKSFQLRLTESSLMKTMIENAVSRKLSSPQLVEFAEVKMFE